MAVWVHDYVFHDPQRSSAELIFAAFNGSIENGSTSQVFNKSTKYPTSISSILCNVDVEFTDDILQVGNGGPPNTPPVSITSIDTMYHPYFNKTGPGLQNTSNENALWFAVSPLMVSIGVDGTQPMFYNQGNRTTRHLPVPYTSSNKVNNTWTTAGIEEFIHVSIGAMALACSRNWRNDTAPRPVMTITSLAYTRKLDPSKVVLLVIPIIIILTGKAALVYLTIRLHRRQRIPAVRMANTSEILRSAQTEFLCGQVAAESGQYENRQQSPVRCSESPSLPSIKVMYGLTRGISADSTGKVELVPGLGGSESVDGF